jgi:hypothetical protein
MHNIEFIGIIYNIYNIYNSLYRQCTVHQYLQQFIQVMYANIYNSLENEIFTMYKTHIQSRNLFIIFKCNVYMSIG